MLKEVKKTFNRSVRELENKAHLNLLLSVNNDIFPFRMFGYIYDMPYGGERRKLILSLLQHQRVLVNRKHAMQTSKDKDLRRMLKEGAIEVISVHTHKSHKDQYIQLKRNR